MQLETISTEPVFLQDNLEWQHVLEEAAVSKLCPQIRVLYVVILMFCQPANPRSLFYAFWNTWTDDFELLGRRRRTPLA